MRIVLSTAAAACALLPLPALAEESETSRMAEEMSDPVRQEQLAAMAETMADVLLEMPAAPLLRAAATMAGEDPEDIDPDVRVGDLVGPEAAEAPREFAHRLPQMMGAMAAVAATLEDIAPLMRERMREALPPDHE
jgi:hypothetical protein